MTAEDFILYIPVQYCPWKRIELNGSSEKHFHFALCQPIDEINVSTSENSSFKTAKISILSTLVKLQYYYTWAITDLKRNTKENLSIVCKVRMRKTIKANNGLLHVLVIRKAVSAWGNHKRPSPSHRYQVGNFWKKNKTSFCYGVFCARKTYFKTIFIR